MPEPLNENPYPPLHFDISSVQIASTSSNLFQNIFPTHLTLNYTKQKISSGIQEREIIRTAEFSHVGHHLIKLSLTLLRIYPQVKLKTRGKKKNNPQQQYLAVLVLASLVMGLQKYQTQHRSDPPQKYPDSTKCGTYI